MYGSEDQSLDSSTHVRNWASSTWGRWRQELVSDLIEEKLSLMFGERLLQTE